MGSLVCLLRFLVVQVLILAQRRLPCSRGVVSLRKEFWDSTSKQATIGSFISFLCGFANLVLPDLHSCRYKCSTAKVSTLHRSELISLCFVKHTVHPKMFHTRTVESNEIQISYYVRNILYNEPW
jgi:hypothetical protein